LVTYLRRAFERADIRAIGRLDASDFRRLLSEVLATLALPAAPFITAGSQAQFNPELTGEDVDALVKVLDSDGDGLIAYKDLLSFMKLHFAIEQRANHVDPVGVPPSHRASAVTPRPPDPRFPAGAAQPTAQE
jgi:hypothetical protein